MAKMGRPPGTGKFGESKSTSFRLSYPAFLFIKEKGGRAYLENLVPESYRVKVECERLGQQHVNDNKKDTKKDDRLRKNREKKNT